MAAKLTVLATLVAACCAKPFYFTAVPGVTILRAGRSPSLAYGFGSGFASDFGGIKHSSSFGTSFQTGDAQAFGGGIGSTNGDPYASGVGFAQTNPETYRTYPVYSTPYTTPYYSYPYNLGYNHFRTPQLRNNYGTAVTSAQSFGGTAIAQSQNGPHGSVASAANIPTNPYQSRYNFRNPGYGESGVSSASAASFADGSGTATSLSSDRQGGFNTAVAAVHNGGGVRSSIAQTVQQNSGDHQHSGATSINGPNFQAAHSHVVNSGTDSGTYY